MQETISRLLIGIDALFDLRLGTIARIDLDKAAGFLHDLNYSSRRWDKFPGVDEKVYEELYKNADVETLQNTQTTAAVGLLHDFVKRCAETSYTQPVAIVPEIYINFWPLKLKPEEEDLIVKYLQKAIPLKPLVSKVNFNFDQLNPMYVRANFKQLIMYNGSEWLEYHKKTELLHQYPCPGVVLQMPLKLDKAPPGVEPPDDWKEKMYTMSVFAQPFINIFYLTIDNFCSYLSRKQPVVKTAQAEEPIPDEVEPEKKP